MDYLGIDADRRPDVMDRIARMRAEMSKHAASTETTSELRHVADTMQTLLTKRLPELLKRHRRTKRDP